MANWDARLPDPLLTGNNSRHTPNSVETPMESGVQRRTLISKAYVGYGSYTLMLNEAGMNHFHDMYDSADHGTEWINNAPADTGYGLAPHRIKITSINRRCITPPNRLWSVVYTWETDEQVRP